MLQPLLSKSLSAARTTPPPLPELLLSPPSLETARRYQSPTDAKHPLPSSSLPFKTAGPPVLLNASCPCPDLPDQTKTWASSPPQSCALGLADLHATRCAQTPKLRGNLWKSKQQLASKQQASGCSTRGAAIPVVITSVQNLTDVRSLEITLSFKYNGIFKVILLECFSFNCLNHHGALRSRSYTFTGKHLHFHHKKNSNKLRFIPHLAPGGRMLNKSSGW